MFVRQGSKGYESLLKGDLKTFNKNINLKEYERTLSYLELTETEFLLKCKEDHMFAKLSSRHISKNASRQGSKDETEKLKTCNITAKKCGCEIKNLSNTEIRPTRWAHNIK